MVKTVPIVPSFGLTTGVAASALGRRRQQASPSPIPIQEGPLFVVFIGGITGVISFSLMVVADS
jgi:hypothetical protein